MALFEVHGMNSAQNAIKKSPAKRANVLSRLLGPGLVTGAADDDPSGIATYSQAGAQFGYGVRRDKAALSSGCKAHPATAPAGSNRSSHGGNEVAEAFGVAGHEIR
jgi:hypothetical protein